MSEIDNDTTLTVTTTSGGTVSPFGTILATKGAATAISAVSASGYCFAGWTVTSGTATIAYPGVPNTTVTLNSPATVHANFAVVGEPNQDSDGDGIPDWWMQKYFGHATGQEWDLSRADDDSDGDGMSNWQEWQAGTDPTNAFSLLAMSGLARHPSVAGQFVIRWQSETNKFYTLQAATNLADGFTLTLGSDIPATPPENVHTDSVEGVNGRFYRVRVGQPGNGSL